MLDAQARLKAEPVRRIGHCLRCQRGFNTIAIVTATRNWPFRQTVDFLESLQKTTD